MTHKGIHLSYDLRREKNAKRGGGGGERKKSPDCSFSPRHNPATRWSTWSLNYVSYDLRRKRTPYPEVRAAWRKTSEEKRSRTEEDLASAECFSPCLQLDPHISAAEWFLSTRRVPPCGITCLIGPPLSLAVHSFVHASDAPFVRRENGLPSRV